MKPVVASYISKSEVEAQVRFERFCSALNAIAEKVAEEEQQWRATCDTHSHFLHGSAWVGLVLVACAFMANWWLVWAGLFCAGVVMWFIIAVKLNEHKDERRAHECRIAELDRERDRIVNHGPTN